MNEPFPTLPDGELEWESVVDVLRQYLERHGNPQLIQLLPSILKNVVVLEGGGTIGTTLPNVRHAAMQLYAYFEGAIATGNTPVFHYIPYPRRVEGRPVLEKDVSDLKKEIDRMNQKVAHVEELEKQLQQERKDRIRLQSEQDAFSTDYYTLLSDYSELEHKYNILKEEDRKETLIPIPKESSDMKALTIANANYEHENKLLREKVVDYEKKVSEMTKLRDGLSKEREVSKGLEEKNRKQAEEIRRLNKSLLDTLDEADEGYSDIAKSIQVVEDENVEYRKEVGLLRTRVREVESLEKENKELVKNNINVMNMLSELQKKHGIKFSDGENTELEKTTKNISRVYDEMKVLVDELRDKLRSYDGIVVVGGGTLGDYDVAKVSVYNKEEETKLLSIINKYNHLELVSLEGTQIVHKGPLSSINHGDVYAIDVHSVVLVNNGLLPKGGEATTLKSRPWEISDYMLKYGKDRRNHSGVGSLELLFRDEESRRMLHMIVGNVSSCTVDLDRGSKNISYKFINTIGRDVVSRKGTLSIKYREGSVLVSNRLFNYVVALPPPLENEGTYGVEMVSDLSSTTKLYTTHISSSMVSVDMLTFPTK
jgi:hypothetical protein